MKRLLAVLVAALALAPTTASAQTYPTRPVTIIVPFAAGGPASAFPCGRPIAFASGMSSFEPEPAQDAAPPSIAPASPLPMCQ
jgi:hypothetical protein